jgi:hypothetical protein
MILEHLKESSITPIDALNKYGCFRLAAVIHKLRKDHNIKTVLEEKNNKSYARYFLVVEPEQRQLW